MGKVIALLCLAAGAAFCATSLGLLRSEYLALEAPRWVVFGTGAVFIVAGLMLLARDHRASDSIATLLLLTFAAITGWATFYAPQGTVQRLFPFIPADVNDALGRLLFGLGAAASVGAAAWALRRLFR